MAFVANSIRLTPTTFEMNGKDLEARTLHSMTLISLSFAMNWMLYGPVIFKALPILAVATTILSTVSGAKS